MLVRLLKPAAEDVCCAGAAVASAVTAAGASVTPTVAPAAVVGGLVRGRAGDLAVFAREGAALQLQSEQSFV